MNQRPCSTRAKKRFHLISYVRAEPKDWEPMNYEQAQAEKDQQELLFPENVHLIEEVPDEDDGQGP